MKNIVIVVLVIGVLVLGYFALKPKSVGTSTPTSVSENNSGTGNTTQPTPSSSNQPAVTGMQEYTDATFGFSFWYPTNWSISTANANPAFGASITNASIVKRLWLTHAGDSSPSIVIQEAHSTTRTITDTGGAGPIGPVTYYFDPNKHLWMTSNSENGTATPLTPANISNNTMGGLHIFPGTSRFNTSIIPLSADNFVVIGDNGGTDITASLTKTILATDPTVATPMSTAQQIQTIQAEANQNTGSSNQSSQTTTISTSLPSYLDGYKGWPAVITHSSAGYSCTIGTGTTEASGKTVEKIIGSRKYCINKSSDGTAGTIYDTYTYTTADTNRTDLGGTITTTFTLAFHDAECNENTYTGNANQYRCLSGQPDFNIDTIVANLMAEKL